MHVRLMCISF